MLLVLVLQVTLLVKQSYFPITENEKKVSLLRHSVFLLPFSLSVESESKQNKVMPMHVYSHISMSKIKVQQSLFLGNTVYHKLLDQLNQINCNQFQDPI